MEINVVLETNFANRKAHNLKHFLASPSDCQPEVQLQFLEFIGLVGECPLTVRILALLDKLTRKLSQPVLMLRRMPRKIK